MHLFRNEIYFHCRLSKYYLCLIKTLSVAQGLADSSSKNTRTI